MAYILDVEDYEKSIRYLEKIKNDYTPADDLREVVEALLGRRKEPGELGKHLKALEEAAPEEDGRQSPFSGWAKPVWTNWRKRAKSQRK